MRPRREIVAAILAGIVMAAVLAVIGVTHYRALLHLPSPDAQASGDHTGLRIPTIEQMCTTLGAAAGDALKQCQTDESASGEFVVAWMGLNGFMGNGGIDIEQIQLLASLDSSDPFAPDSSLGLDPSLSGDPSQLGDPTLGGSGDTILGGVNDPLTGESTPLFQSAAQLALFCLGESSDWTKLHECISQNDPSSRFSGAQ
jgi:hypothetical protein